MATSRLAKNAIATSFCAVLAGSISAAPALGDVQQCGDLIICVDIPVPGSEGSGGTGGGSGNQGGDDGGGEVDPFPQGTGDPGIPPQIPPAGDPVIPPPAPAEVAALALAQLQMRKPIVHMNPSEGNLGLVGLPVWLWIDSNDPTRWSPDGISKTLTVRGVTVTVVARSTLVTWDMGNGETKECRYPGRPYQPNQEINEIDCTYKYATTSQGQPDDKFAVSATVTWEASYTSSAGTFDLDDLSGSAGTTVRVGELQVMN